MTVLRIPAARLAPLVQEWIDDFNAAAPTPSNGGNKRGGSTALAGIVARLRGVEPAAAERMLSRLLNAGAAVSLANADALLCAIDQPEAWHLELADLYEAAA